MTSVPYPTFSCVKKQKDRAAMAAVGRCRIHPLLSPSPPPSNDDDDTHRAYQAIVNKCIEQSRVDDKPLQKKYMKESVALASDYLTKTLGLDVSIVDVEIVLKKQHVSDTDGNLASCFLDAGCARIVLLLANDDDDDHTGGSSSNNNEETTRNLSLLQEAVDAARLPRERLMVHIQDYDDKNSIFKIMDRLRADCASISVFCQEEIQMSRVLEFGKQLDDLDVVVQISPTTATTTTTVADLVGRLSQQTPSNTTQTTVSLINPTPEQLGLCYAACLKTDRDDGLFSTVVCTRSGEALGLVYSSTESIVAALECGRGVYYSRSRQSLWRKGDTSGHYQTLHRIDVDCDGDAIRFTVTQRGDDVSAFCHLDTLTCWGPPRGLSHLEETLQDRLKSAPEGSYTKRLFEDRTLLQEKLVEEAQELSEAETPQHVAEELADVLYFALVRAAKAGVKLDDAVAELDRRARKVTRRKGDSKAFRIEAGKAILEKAKDKK